MTTPAAPANLPPVAVFLSEFAVVVTVSFADGNGNGNGK
jgi:hypothetical protein